MPKITRQGPSNRAEEESKVVPENVEEIGPSTDEHEGTDIVGGVAADVGPVRPSFSASKTEWVAYAEAVSGEEIDYDAVTRTALIELYGQD